MWVCCYSLAVWYYREKIELVTARVGSNRKSSIEPLGDLFNFGHSGGEGLIREGGSIERGLNREGGLIEKGLNSFYGISRLLYNDMIYAQTTTYDR